MIFQDNYIKEKKSQKQYLRRYTNLSSLFDILKNKRITLLNPNTWDDKNDSYFIEQYKIKSKLMSVLGLCFAGRSETFHHWKVYSYGLCGVCIIFQKNNLLKLIKDEKGIKYKEVVYKKINELKNNQVKLCDMPFIKRIPYKDEKEFRVIYESKNEELNYKFININLSCIERIVLSPWIPGTLIELVRKTIKEVSETRISVWKTTILNNDAWKSIGNNI